MSLNAPEALYVRSSWLIYSNRELRFSGTTRFVQTFASFAPSRFNFSFAPFASFASSRFSLFPALNTLNDLNDLNASNAPSTKT